MLMNTGASQRKKGLLVSAYQETNRSTGTLTVSFASLSLSFSVFFLLLLSVPAWPQKLPQKWRGAASWLGERAGGLVFWTMDSLGHLEV